ncbi:hypothetical protein ACFSSF_02800 [Dietzia aerolata]|uniref:hypothetical protein n=1 Tax=Dietzia aerolata TaxID=595984 RepID=UPI003625EBE3
MFQRRPSRTVTRNRSLVLGGALAALAVVGGGTVVAVNSPAEVEADGIQLTQNTAGQAGQAAAQEMPLGTAVNLDLEPVVARAAGGTIPPGTTVKVTGLPDGLTQDGWVISGTPTRVGEYDVLVTVSNAGVSRSQRVTIAVTDEADGATSPAQATSPAAGADQDPSTSGQSGPSDQSDQSDEEDSTDESEPTLSSVPGDPSRADATTTADGEAPATAPRAERTIPAPVVSVTRMIPPRETGMTTTTTPVTGWTPARTCVRSSRTGSLTPARSRCCSRC